MSKIAADLDVAEKQAPGRKDTLIPMLIGGLVSIVIGLLVVVIFI